MRMPFERLVEYAAGLTEEDKQLSVAELARRVGQPLDRFLDAADAVKMLRGQVTYFSVASLRGAENPLVREADLADRGGVVTGMATAPLDMSQELPD